MRNACLPLVLLMCSFAAQALEAGACASTIKDLRLLAGDPSFSSRWSEVSMDDGKPLVVSIIERRGALSLEFLKTGDGLWAETSGVICKAGASLEARVSKEQIVLGPAANWMLSLALANGGVFTMHRRVANQLQIETRGWSGRFAPVLTE